MKFKTKCLLGPSDMLLATYTFSYKYITGALKLHTGKFYLTDIFILALNIVLVKTIHSKSLQEVF